MQSKTSRNVAFMLVAVLLGSFAGCKESAPTPETKVTQESAKADKDSPKTSQDENTNSGNTSFPSDISKAWTDAKAQTGWMSLQDDGVTFSSWEFHPGDLPAFCFLPATWNEDTILKLPAPETPFGIALSYGVAISPKGVKALGRFENLQILTLIMSEVTDAGVKELTGMKNLKVLALDSCNNVTDAGVKQLAALKSLQIIELSMIKTTDETLKQLASLPNLRGLNLVHSLISDVGMKDLPDKMTRLNLSHTDVTDKGMKEISRLKDLQEITLPVLVTDSGIKELAGLKNLRLLGLMHTRLTDAGAKELAGLANLQNLDLRGTKITDACLRALAGLVNLQQLRLGSTNITDGGLKVLAGFKQLKELDLHNTKTTEAAVNELQKALPKCNISK